MARMCASAALSSVCTEPACEACLTAEGSEGEDTGSGSRTGVLERVSAAERNALGAMEVTAAEAEVEAEAEADAPAAAGADCTVLEGCSCGGDCCVLMGWATGGCEEGLGGGGSSVNVSPAVSPSSGRGAWLARAAAS